MSGTAHGHTPAAWTGVTIAFIGFCVSGLFMVAANPLGFWGGLVIVFAGLGVGLAMKSAGLGTPKETDARIRARERAHDVALSKTAAAQISS
ncbi:HGxxPAAW family protein [Streptomyces sp. NPDC004609]|uniref:HGxxPAAW family protein n=1 Tax=Streptomyces sp. NPDC004609 TaxID=3364704 RepID=UPI0036766ED7